MKEITIELMGEALSQPIRGFLKYPSDFG